MSERRKRARPATAGMRADQTDIDGAVARSDIGASGSHRRSPNDLEPSVAGFGPRGGSSSVSGGGAGAVPAGGSALATPTFLAAVAAVALGLIVLLGWATGGHQLTTLLPDAVPMKANAALLLVLSGAALAVRALGHRPRLVGALAIVVLVVASASAVEYATGIDLGIDRLLASDVARPGAPYPGRMAFSAVVGFGACAFGLLSLEHTWRGWHPSAFLALTDAVIGGLGVLGYAYGASQLTSVGSVTQIAFPAAIGLVLLAGALIATDPEHGLMLLLRDPGPTGGLTRRLVPTALLILPLFGWLELGFINSGVFDDHIGVAVLVFFEALILGAVGVWTAGGVLQTERTRETERKGAVQALHDSAVLLNVTQELAKIGAWKYEAATDTVTWTDEVYRIHELSRDEYEPNSAAGDIAFYAPGDQARIDEAFRLAVSDGRSYDLELHLNTARGHEIWVRTSGRPEIEHGRVVRIYGDIQDITERKRAEEELRATNVRLRRFVDANLLGVFEARLEGTVVEANDYFLDLVGHTRAELERGEIDWLAMTAPESRPSSDAAVREMRARGSASYEKEYLRPDGTRVPVLVADALFPGSDNVIGGFVLDITERTRAEQTIRELAQLVESAHDAIIVRTADSRVRFWSRGAEALYGWSAAEAVGRMTHELLQTVFPVSVESTDDDLESNGRWQGELRHTTRDGRLVVVESRQSVERDPAGRVTKIIEINRDITERKAAEEGIRELNAELDGRVTQRTIALEAANRELEAFSYSVSHDLRAPLRSIDGFSRILLDEHSATLDAEGTRVLGVVIRNAKQMGLLIDDLLAFSRVARANLERHPVDMQRLAQGVAEELQAAYPDREVAFDVGPLVDVPGDQALLRQVWLNLLGNAVKFTRPVQHAAVEVRSERGGGECSYTVRDNGVGFDPAYADNLFKPFQRLHPTSEFEGTGVGLAIVARIVQRHGGRVWAEAAPDSGALFSFSLPNKLEAT